VRGHKEKKDITTFKRKQVQNWGKIVSTELGGVNWGAGVAYGGKAARKPPTDQEGYSGLERGAG